MLAYWQAGISQLRIAVGATSAIRQSGAAGTVVEPRTDLARAAHVVSGAVERNHRIMNEDMTLRVNMSSQQYYYAASFAGDVAGAAWRYAESSRYFDVVSALFYSDNHVVITMLVAVISLSPDSSQDRGFAVHNFQPNQKEETVGLFHSGELPGFIQSACGGTSAKDDPTGRIKLSLR